MPVRLISRQAREHHPENSVGYSFIIKGKSGEGKKTTFFLILPSSAPPPAWAEEFSYPYVVKLGLA